jgi:hypothetical protein
MRRRHIQRQRRPPEGSRYRCNGNVEFLAFFSFLELGELF